MELLTVRDLKYKNVSGIHPIVFDLLQMDERIRLYPLFGDYQDNKGFFVTKNNIFIPYVLPSVQHDIAHLLELTNCKRWTIPDWGMPRFDADKIPARSFFAALAREVRTRAIQCHITCFESEEKKLASTAYDQFNNFYWAEMAGKCLPFGRFKSYQDLTNWMAELRERTHKAWSLDRIVHEWKIRLNHIQNWMESQ